MAQWHLDEVASSTAPDSSGSGLTGDEVSGTLVPGRFGSALSTPNNNDGFRVPANPLLEPSQITVMAWVNKGAPFNVFRTIVSKGSDSCGTRESYALDTGPDGGIRFLAYQGGSSFADVANVVPPASLWNGQWHAVAGTFDGTTVRLYVDGVAVGSASAPVPGGAIQYGLPESRLAVARFPEDGACDPNGFQFRGAVDEVRVYNRALTGDEVAYLQNAGATTPPSLPIPAPAPELVWDINGDGHGDVTCSAGAPVLGLRLLTAQTVNVKLTAVALDGRVSVVSKPLTVNRARLAARRRRSPTWRSAARRGAPSRERRSAGTCRCSRIAFPALSRAR